MSVVNRVNTLELRHYEIEEKLRKAYLNHVHDGEIALLKKQKLLLKEAIAHLSDSKN